MYTIYCIFVSSFNMCESNSSTIFKIPNNGNLNNCQTGWKLHTIKKRYNTFPSGNACFKSGNNSCFTFFFFFLVHIVWCLIFMNFTFLNLPLRSMFLLIYFSNTLISFEEKNVFVFKFREQMIILIILFFAAKKKSHQRYLLFINSNCFICSMF